MLLVKLLAVVNGHCLYLGVQLDQRCKELDSELLVLKQRIASVERSHAELQRNFVTLYRVAGKALAQRDSEIRRLNSR